MNTHNKSNKRFVGNWIDVNSFWIVITLSGWLLIGSVSRADTWMLPHRNFTSGLDAQSFANSQKANAAIWGNASRDFEYRSISPIAEQSSNSIRIHSIVKKGEGVYEREFVRLIKGVDGDWRIGEKNSKPVSADKVIGVHKILRQFVINARFPPDEINVGFDNSPILWECKFSLEEGFVLQAMQFDLPKIPEEKTKFDRVLDVVMGEMPSPPRVK